MSEPARDESLSDVAAYIVDRLLTAGMPRADLDVVAYKLQRDGQFEFKVKDRGGKKPNRSWMLFACIPGRKEFGALEDALSELIVCLQAGAKVDF